MSNIEIEDPILLDTFDTDSKGRINLGEAYGNKTVKVCVVSVVDEPP